MWMVVASHDDVEKLVMFGTFESKSAALRVCRHVDVHDGWDAYAYRIHEGVAVEQVLAMEMERAVGWPDFRL